MAQTLQQRKPAGEMTDSELKSELVAQAQLVQRRLKRGEPDP